MMAMNFQVDLLIELLKRCKTSAEKGYVLQLFIQTYGPLPDSRKDEVMKLIETQIKLK